MGTASSRRHSRSGSGGGSGAAGAGDDKAAHEKKLNLYIWSAYLAKDTLSVFEQRYGVGTKKNSSDRQGFLPFLNAWLTGTISDGTWGRLYAQDIAPASKETKTKP